MGCFTNLATYNNKGYGFFAYGETAGINAIRMYNSFLGNDNAGEIRLLTKGAVGGLLSNVYCEIAGYEGAGRNSDSAVI